MTEAYCVKCKHKVTISNPKTIVAKGRKRVAGKCAKCGTKVTTFVKS